ncbi:MAG: DUF2306 domain-containing protein [Pseudomonadota bacterium]
MDFSSLLAASPAIKIHVATVVPAAFIGPAQFLLPKGTALHRAAGYLFMGLMLVTSVAAFFIPSFMGPRFSYIHLFIIVTVVGIVRAWFAINRGDVRGHAIALASVYLGAIGIAGYFAFMPGRIMHELFFGPGA